MNLLEFAQECARCAGDVLRRSYARGFSVATKSAHHDLVTSADLEAEKTIVKQISSKFPEHNILAEENNYPQTRSPFRWIVDPLDGTTNFSKGIPVFSVSIALQKGSELIAGVVYDPLRDELFAAQRGQGSFLNGRPLSVSTSDDLKEAVLFTGFHYDRGQHMEETLAIIRRFFLAGIIGIRRTGSAALDLAYVAAGRCDGFWEHMLQPWDVAAGMLLVREAGGRATDRNGLDIDPRASYTVASNGLIHRHMLAVIGDPASVGGT